MGSDTSPQADPQTTSGTLSRIVLASWAVLAGASGLLALLVVLGSSPLFVTSDEAGSLATGGATDVIDPPTVTVDTDGSAGTGPVDPLMTAAVRSPMTAPPATGMFGGRIGRDTSVTALVDRYTALARRQPDLFAGLEPLIAFDETGTSLAADLIAGPFEQRSDAALFCRVMRLQLTIECETEAYRGDAFLPR